MKSQLLLTLALPVLFTGSAFAQNRAYGGYVNRSNGYVQPNYGGRWPGYGQTVTRTTIETPNLPLSAPGMIAQQITGIPSASYPSTTRTTITTYGSPYAAYGYPSQGYGYPSPVYPAASAYPYTAPLGPASSVTVIPLNNGYQTCPPSYSYGAYNCPPYTYPSYGYPAYGYPGYGYTYPVQTAPSCGTSIPYPVYVQPGIGSYSTTRSSTGFGLRAGSGGVSINLGGSNYSSTTSTQTTIR